jgi:hypothetical protein
MNPVIKSTKELWEKLSILFEGTRAIQRQRYEAAKQDMQMFVVIDGESIASAYARHSSQGENHWSWM